MTVKIRQPASAPKASVDSSQRPSAIPETILNASARDHENLVDIEELLDRLFVRNRNQHRRSHWFKSLHQFRKQLSLLLNELASVKKSSLPATLEKRLKYWDEQCIHNWYMDFTQLVPVGPFAILGLVLMACTARVCRITGITASYEEIASEDMQNIFSGIDNGTLIKFEFEGYVQVEEAEPKTPWDMGVIVEREEDDE